MCQATLDLISPNGVPVTLHVTDVDDQQAILDIVNRAEKIGLYFVERGWTFSWDAAAIADTHTARQGRTFAGYPCSPTVDERGFPTWIVVDGKQALRREKQGDVWYSVKVAGRGVRAGAADSQRGAAAGQNGELIASIWPDVLAVHRSLREGIIRNEPVGGTIAVRHGLSVWRCSAHGASRVGMQKRITMNTATSTKHETVGALRISAATIQRA